MTPLKKHLPPLILHSKPPEGDLHWSPSFLSILLFTLSQLTSPYFISILSLNNNQHRRLKLMMYTITFLQYPLGIIFLLYIVLSVVSWFKPVQCLTKVEKVWETTLYIVVILTFTETCIRYNFMDQRWSDTQPIQQQVRTECPPPVFQIDTVRYEGDFIYDGPKIYIQRKGLTTNITSK